MSISKRHVALLIGISLVFGSFLFFGRKTDTYQTILLTGLGASIVAYFSILFAKKRIREKSIWTVFVFGMALACHVTSPYLIKASYLIYVNSHHEELVQIISMMEKWEGEVRVFEDVVRWNGEMLETQEAEEMQTLLKRVDAYTIIKTPQSIYIGLWGFLDIRHGITYYPTGMRPPDHLRELKFNWYH